MKIANNALTYSIILIVVFYIILYTATSNAYPNEDGAIVEAAYPVINTKGDERATDNDTIEIKPSPEMAKTISLEAAPAAKSKENEAATTGFVKKAEAAHLGAARVVHISAPAVKPVRKKIERRIEKVSTGTATVPNRRKLSDTEMFLIMTMVKERCFTLGLKSNCVRIIKTKASNIDNAFALAPYFQKNGYVIAGREERSLEETGIRVDVEGIIFKVIVGKN